MNTDPTNQFGSEALSNTAPTANADDDNKLLKLNLTDNFLFGALFSQPKYFIPLVSTLLNRPVRMPVENIINKEETKKIFYGYKGVRLDVFFEDTEQLIDLEMQNISDIRNPLPKRASYYTSSLVNTSLKVGKPYSDKLDTYVIFLCDFDPFGLGDYKYEARYSCKSVTYNKLVPYNAGDSHYYFNLRADILSMPATLRELFEYIRNTRTYQTTSHTPQIVNTLIGGVNMLTQEAKNKIDYDRYLEEHAKTHFEGKTEGKIEIAINLLRAGKLSNKEISDATGLSLKNIENIALKLT